ncbi:MAG: MBL fold metallo-hydrolase [Candidatus Margulisiibacteriota bacterium]|nr:MBL fold metallo-hydrolase [Candidatus Margulisiibacteriota bacterium]
MNYDEAVQIADGVYWVGFYDSHANFHCNPYLIVDHDEAILIEPGSVPHFPIVARKVISVIDPKKISYILLSHQDPDLAGSLPVFEDLINNPELKIVTSERASFLISFYGIRSPYYLVDKNDLKLKLKSGRELTFILTPYLHSPAAFVTYDTKSRILFSGDLFGAFSDSWELYAKDSYNNDMKKFHVPYMPSNDVLASAMKNIEKLDIEMIAPQHGSIIKKDLVKSSIGFLKDLKCGVPAI